MISLHFTNDPVVNFETAKAGDNSHFMNYFHGMLSSGVYLPPSPYESYFLNDALTYSDIDLTIDALKRGSSKSIAAIMPYYGYARQDRKSGPRSPISAKLVANLISTAGANRALMVDLHAGQIQGFFDIPTDNLFAAPVFIDDIKTKFENKKQHGTIHLHRIVDPF